MQPLTPEPQGAGLGAPPFFEVFSPTFRPPSDACHMRVRFLTTRIKSRQTFADNRGMIISDEQARRVAEYLGSTTEPLGHPTDRVVCTDIVHQACTVALGSPDAREDRVADAKERLLSGLPLSADIANKMVSRILCDSIR